ncbi:unnamed protein product [Cylindrotheca closterium]|uniref:Uncharacterized protein n=1 Tax=Cylindrotheca closterium TaxID=2856 RepID=A0AAD2FR86_9STRA|nr:unnamed protein product [Cylindrotheca closterium]
MGKSTSLKVVSTTANKAGGSTPKSVSVAKKSGEKRLENASAVDLRQPKDRDPSVNNDSEIQELIASLPPLIDFGLSTHDLVAIGYDYNSTKISFGNSIFNQWMENHNNRWTQALPRFDSPFKDLYANYSIEGRVNMLFAQYANDWRRVLKFLISLFDDGALGNVKKIQNTHGVEIHKGVKKIFDPDYEDSEEEDDPTGDKDTGLVNKFGQPNRWDSDKTVDNNPNDRRKNMDIDDDLDSNNDGIYEDDDDKDVGEEDDDDTDESAKDSVILVESTYQTTDNDKDDDNDNMGPNTNKAVSELTGVTGEDKDPELASPPRKKGRSHRVSVVDQPTEMEVDGGSFSEAGAKRTHSVSASQSTNKPAQKTDTTSTKQSSKAKRRLQRSLTLHERLDGLRQVNLDGMDGQAILVALGMPYNYQGQQGGNKTHASIILNHILDTLADVLKNTEETIRFLPLSDSA